MTCEHGGHRVPREYARLFKGHRALLNSHRGWDAGALHLARSLAKRFDAPLFEHTFTRLLVDLNRSLDHSRLFSAMTKSLPADEREKIIDRWYLPHRRSVRDAVERAVKSGSPVLHIAVHSFTPVLDGKVRAAEIGLLYDPMRRHEKQFCRQWKSFILRRQPDWRVRFNYPYRGTADGLTTALRREFPVAPATRRVRADRYLGIELEVNQRLLSGSSGKFPPRVQGALIESIADALR